MDLVKKSVRQLQSSWQPQKIDYKIGFCLFAVMQIADKLDQITEKSVKLCWLLELWGVKREFYIGSAEQLNHYFVSVPYNDIAFNQCYR